MKEGFKCPAVYDGSNEKYVAVTENNQIITWTEDSSSLEKFKKNLVCPIVSNNFCHISNVFDLDKKSYLKALLSGRCCKCGLSQWSNFAFGRHIGKQEI